MSFPATHSPPTRPTPIPAFAVGIGVILGLLCSLQSEAPPIQFANLTTRDGLADGPLVQIIQDFQGRIWFAHRSGLARFDGYELRPVLHVDQIDPEQPVHSIRAFAEDRRNGFWIGTESGLVQYQPERNSFRIYRHSAEAKTSICRGAVTALLPEGRDFLWVGTESGLCRLHIHSGIFTRVSANPLDRESIECIALAPGTAASLWVGTRGSGLFRLLPDGTWEAAWEHRPEIRSITSSIQEETGEAVLWVGTMGQGLFACDRTGRPQTQYLPESGAGIPDRDILTLRVDSRNAVWAGTPRGVSRLVPKSETWCTYRHDRDLDHTLAQGSVSAIYEDRRGVLWIGTENGDVSRHSLDQSWFPHFHSVQGGASSLSHDSVWGMCERAAGGAWVGTEGGLDSFDPATGGFERWTCWPKEDGRNSHPYVFAVEEDRKGRVWVGTRGGGLMRLSGAQESVKHFAPDPGNPESLPGDSVSAIFEDRRGCLWVAVLGSGLLRFDDDSESFHPVNPSMDEAWPGFVNQLAEDTQGRLWAGCTTGLFLLDSTQEKLVHYLQLPAAKDRLPLENVTALAQGSRGCLWIGTAGPGVFCFEPDTGSLTRFLAGGVRGGVHDIFGLAEDAEGNVWISSKAGLDQLNPSTKSFRHFSNDDGVQTSQFHSGSFLRMRDGTLLLGGPEGLDQIDPKRIPAPRKPPRPILTGLDLYGQVVTPSLDGVLPRPLMAMMDSPLRLPYDRKMRFALRFGTLDYASLDQNRFEYRLDGFDDCWQKARADRVAAYQNPAPGRYRFEVRASPDGTRWESLMHPLEIIIDPPWYKTSWAIWLFAGLGLSGISGGVFAFFHIRGARERSYRERLENERNRAEAALSRQVQHSMLFERTSAEFRRSLDSAQVFEAGLRSLGEYLKIRRCFLAALGEGAERMEMLGQYAAPGLPPLKLRKLSRSHPLAARILESDGAVNLGLEDVSSLAPEPNTGSTGEEQHSVWGIRTAYLERANGIIVLHQDGACRPWSQDELQLLESLAGQLGIAVAQFLLSQKEARQALELQEARVAAEAANKAKGDFLAKMTHELRTPLNAIIGFSEVLNQDPGLNKAQRDYLDIINSSGEHLLGVINDVLEISKVEAGKAELLPEQFELEKVLQSIRGMMSDAAEKKGVDLRLIIEGDLPRRVEADKRKFRQIIVNLLSNAVKFTSKGSVALVVSAKLDRLECCGEDSTGGRVPARLDIRVQDTGEGIEADELPGLFGTFVQTKSGKMSLQGSGLGLAIVQGFTRLMGGTVDVRSSIGKGTVFSLQIPVVALRGDSAGGGDRDAKRKEEVVGLAPGHREVRVLVVEDQPLNRLLMKKLLVKAGFTMGEAENGWVAVETWKKFRPDIIFMDENMPVMSGTEATRRIAREAGGRMPPIVSLTAFALEEQRRAALAAGCVDFMAKPFKREELFDIIGRHCAVTYQYREEFAEAA